MAKTTPNLVRDAAYGDLIQDPMYPNIAQQITINGASNRNAIDLTSVIIELTPTIDCIYALGDGTVVANSGEDHFLPAFGIRRINTGENLRVAVQNYISGESGQLFISEML